MSHESPRAAEERNVAKPFGPGFEAELRDESDGARLLSDVEWRAAAAESGPRGSVHSVLVFHGVCPAGKARLHAAVVVRRGEGALVLYDLGVAAGTHDDARIVALEVGSEAEAWVLEYKAQLLASRDFAIAGALDYRPGACGSTTGEGLLGVLEEHLGRRVSFVAAAAAVRTGHAVANPAAETNCVEVSLDVLRRLEGAEAADGLMRQLQARMGDVQGSEVGGAEAAEGTEGA